MMERGAYTLVAWMGSLILLNRYRILQSAFERHTHLQETTSLICTNRLPMQTKGHQQDTFSKYSKV